MTAPTVDLTTTVTLNLDDLAELMANHIGRYGISDADLIEFIMTLDAYVADLGFTKELHQRLGSAIESEEACA
ncbi:hypothetical protein [Actinomadura oligospora]|uniref:hypothetical protein n=1 Tax=Actinomadura oligospora TaxID=111804 RepID=UPI000479CFE4|nr:hypothetical protein [Actinomadura oligospora]